MNDSGIYLVEGLPGHGKTYYCMTVIESALERGLPVATNIQLHDGWALEMARANLFRRLSRRRCEAKAAEYERLLYVVHSAEELMRLRLERCGKCKACRKGRACAKEGRGVAALDEAYKWLDSRTWNLDASGRRLSRDDATLARKQVNDWFAQHRKFGWLVYLIAQDGGMLDSRLRQLHENRVRVKNVRRLGAWYNPLRLLPVNVFVAITVWSGDKTGRRSSTKVYGLNKRIAELYDTMATVGLGDLDEDDADVICLPLRRPAPAHDEEADHAV